MSCLHTQPTNLPKSKDIKGSEVDDCLGQSVCGGGSFLQVIGYSVMFCLMQSYSSMERTLHSSSLPKHWATSPAAVSNKKVDCVEQFRWSGSEPMTDGSIVQMSTCGIRRVEVLLTAVCWALKDYLTWGTTDWENIQLTESLKGHLAVASEEALTCIVGVIPHTHVAVEGQFKNLGDPETAFITFW